MRVHGKALNVSSADIFHQSKNQIIYNRCYTQPQVHNEVFKETLLLHTSLPFR